VLAAIATCDLNSEPVFPSMVLRHAIPLSSHPLMRCRFVCARAG
jgi:hypothetical protein